MCTAGCAPYQQPQLIALEQSNIECEDAIKANDSDLYYRKNVEFYECIYSAFSNVFLAEETGSLRRLARWLKSQIVGIQIMAIQITWRYITLMPNCRDLCIIRRLRRAYSSVG